MSTEGVRNLRAAVASIREPWQPHRLASVNDYDVKVVKLSGEFVWHSHPETDELFLVIDGTLVIQLRDRDVTLGPDDVFVVPRGVEHCPRADGEVSAILIEPRGTVNTGDAGGERTAPVRELRSGPARNITTRLHSSVEGPVRSPPSEVSPPARFPESPA